MGTPRRLAAGLLRTVVRLAPAESRGWASAMLRELDFVHGDWGGIILGAGQRRRCSCGMRQALRGHG